eukprot:6729156-Pyramimonas_sp.AAC.1
MPACCDKKARENTPKEVATDAPRGTNWSPNTVKATDTDMQVPWYPQGSGKMVSRRSEDFPKKAPEGLKGPP